MTVVAHYNSQGCEISRIELSDYDATGEAIARAAMELIASCMSMSEGDRITVETA
jgi:hypothetical protein